MPKPQKQVVCLAETGWAGIRDLTITLARKRICSTCIIKGKLSREILAIITQYSEISLIPIRRAIYKLFICIVVVKNFLLKSAICLVMDSRKNYPWVSKINSIFGIKTIFLEEKGQTFNLFLNNKPINIDFILNLAAR